MLMEMLLWGKEISSRCDNCCQLAWSGGLVAGSPLCRAHQLPRSQLQITASAQQHHTAACMPLQFCRLLFNGTPHSDRLVA